MSRAQLKRPSPGTALGLLALIVALAGTANAGSKRVVVHRGDIAKGAVTAKALAKGAVHPKALAKNAIHPKALAPGAVNAKALAKDSVSPTALRAGAVTSAALAPNAVTATAIAPGSVYGGALGPVSIHVTPIADLDESPAPGSWTPSNTETAMCGAGERLITGGIAFTNTGNSEVGVLQVLPFSNSSAAGVTGRITSNSAGTAAAEVQATCLK